MQTDEKSGYEKWLYSCLHTYTYYSKKRSYLLKSIICWYTLSKSASVAFGPLIDVTYP